MDFLLIVGFDTLPGKAINFQKWVQENSNKLAEAAPEGVTLVGIYASMYYSGYRKDGLGKIIWRLDSYGAQDNFAKAAAGDTEFSKLLNELGSLRDVRSSAGFSTELLKSVKDLSIWADIPEE